MTLSKTISRFMVAACVAAVVSTFAVGCGGGGGDGGGPATPQTPAQILASLTSGGGGVGGAALAVGGTFHGKAIDEGTNAAIAGVGVSLNDENGAVIASGTTNASGTIEFANLTTQPTSVTFVDPSGRRAMSLVGSAQSPLRSVAVASFERTPSFELELTGITPGTDVLLMMNGVVVGARDNCAATETFTISGAIETDTVSLNPIASLVDGEFPGHNVPWLLIAHEYQNDTAGTPESAILSRASYMTDVNGTSAATTTPTALTLNMGTGAGTTGNGVTSGLCTVGTANGNITASAFQFGLIPTLAGVPNVTLAVANDFGVFTYSRLMVDVNNIQTSLIVPLLAGASVAYEVNYPILPAGFASGVWDSEERTAQVALGSSAQFLAIAQGDLSGLTDLLQTLTIVIRRSESATVGGARNFGLNSLGTIGPATVTANVTVDTINGAAAPALVTLLVARLDADTVFLSAGAMTGTTATLPAIGGSAAALPIQNAQLAVFTADGGLGTGQTPSGVGVVHMPRGALTGLTSISANGNPTVSGNYSLGGALTLNVTNPTSVATTYDLATDRIQWTGGGLAGRMGVFTVSLALDTATATSREWEFTINRAAVSTSGGTSYSLKLPTLPTGAPFDTMAVTAATATMGVGIEYIDTHAAGIDPNNYTLASLAAPAASPFVGDVVAALPSVSVITLVNPAVVNPE